MSGKNPTEVPSLPLKRGSKVFQAEVCTKLSGSSEKFRTSPKAQESQVTRVCFLFFGFFFLRTRELPQVRKDITDTKRRVSTRSHSTRTHSHHRGTDGAGQGAPAQVLSPVWKSNTIYSCTGRSGRVTPLFQTGLLTPYFASFNSVLQPGLCTAHRGH